VKKETINGHSVYVVDDNQNNRFTIEKSSSLIGDGIKIGNKEEETYFNYEQVKTFLLLFNLTSNGITEVVSVLEQFVKDGNI
jgi:hypothetical protein